MGAKCGVGRRLKPKEKRKFECVCKKGTHTPHILVLFLFGLDTPKMENITAILVSRSPGDLVTLPFTYDIGKF